MKRFFLAAILVLTAFPAWADSAWQEGGNGYSQAREEAAASGRPLVIYFYTDWCPYCRKFERNILTDAGVKESLQNYVKVKLNPEKGPQENQLADRYGVEGFPTVYFETIKPAKKIEAGRAVSEPAAFARAAKSFSKNKAEKKASPVAAAAPSVLTEKIYLKNGRKISGNIVRRDPGGIMLATADMGEVYFSNSEIEKTEKIKS